ncbi:hypothetical protein SPI_04032 [Niveomyces insectorum RCEF 264]|uniref:tRNA-splicing endonuclease n=1 Tax=Niveomyces insectorum RCEF 264 TaxID=1081102 RepID=A0A162J1M3_9HYPO|nr:hypothetical protein SPI_04032 [Niveomyces insectorum RCEF 264]
MKTPQEVYEEIIRSHQELERIPPEVHLFCPRLSDDDLEDYDDPQPTPGTGSGSGSGSTLGGPARQARIDDGHRRLQLTSWASLILGISREQADRWLGDWVRRTESFLVKCDACVRAWHMERKALKSRLLKEFDEETANIMEGRLHEYDTARIDRGLKRAVAILEQQGPMSSAKLVAIDAPAVLAFYEALCCVEYLSLPDNRRLFNHVFQKTQEKKPLKIASAVIPTMTVFLFQADPLRNRFARTAWERRPAQSLTPAQFDWAVSDHLADAIDAVSRPDVSDEFVQLFWDGFLLLLDAMSEDIVLHGLRGMQIPLDVYQLAMKHLERPADQVLALVLRTLCALMDKSAKAFWDALSLMNPPQLPMFVTQSPAFAPFLARSFEPSMQLMPNGVDAHARVPLLVAFVRALMRSLNRNQRADVCDYLLTVFLTSTPEPFVTATREGHSTCIVAGLTALQMTLDGYLKEARYRLTAESALFVNTVINNTVKHQDYVVRSANLHPGDRYNIGLSQAAVGVVEAALALDTRAIHDEWQALRNSTRPLPSHPQQQQQQQQQGNERRSQQLWDGFRAALSPGRLDLARVMLAATLALRGVQRFAPKKRQLVVDDEAKRRFNNELDHAAEAIAETIARISETLRRADLQRLLGADAQSRTTMYAVVATLVHAEDPIREAGFQLISTVVDEDGRSEAIGKMVHEFPVLFLTAFADSVDHLTSGSSGGNGADPARAATQASHMHAASPFAPMRHIFRCSKDILDGLCDTSTGLLRSRPLTADERHAVKRWWTMAWQFVDHSFLRARAWNEDVEKTVMENYCRDVMEFAEQLMAQDGLIASALGGSSSTTTSTSLPFATASPPTTAAPAPTATTTTTTDKNDEARREVLDAPRKYSMGLFEMIQLRDPYLVGIIVGILVKLFSRLKEFDMKFSDRFVNAIRSTYTPHAQFRNKFKVNTNLNDTQRAELMKAIGDGGDEEDNNNNDVEIITWTTPTPSGATRTLPTKKKQTTIEAWSRAAASATASPSPASSVSSKASGALPQLSSKDAASQLTPGLNKHKALLDKLKASAAAKPDQKALLATRKAIRESRARDKAEIEKHKAEAIARARALRGAPPLPAKSDIMVGSASEDEDEEDEDEDDDDGTAALIQQSKKGEQMLDEAERRKRLALQQMAARQPVKKVKLQRSAKDMRARIIPNMDRLHQAILEWDIFHEGTDPPNSKRCEAVAEAYPSPAEYKRTFFPLLISEAWRSFVTDKDETTAKPFGVKVVTRISVDNFLEVSTLMPAVNNNNNNNNRDRDRAVGEGDIVLLSQADDPLHPVAGQAAPHCLSRVWKTTYKRDNIEVTYRLSSRKNQILPVLLPGAEFRAVKITNMTTIEREFAALESLQYYDLMDEVLKAAPSPMLPFGDEAVADVARNYALNRGQALAILHGKANDGFTLVQGPPGTGKTKTIVAMVGALLTGTIKATATSTGAVALSRPGGGNGGGSGSGSGGGPPGDNTMKKLLVCAPSNAAVDELVLRLKQGVKETTGATRKINVLRLGRSEAINTAVRDVTLEELVKAEIARQTMPQKTGGGGANSKNGSSGSTTPSDDNSGGGQPPASDREKLHQRAGEIKTKIQALLPALEAARCQEDVDRGHLNQLQREHDQLRSEQRRLGAEIERDKESGNTYAREAEIKRRQIQQRILSEAHVLCATLSGSGHEVFKNLNVEFETVIIDEAAQCVELSALIPLKYGCAKCVLVGDPKQLPPTVLSQSAARYGYDQSLFVRMQRNRPQDVHLLDTQYRMHPEISRFPSQQFYDGRLIDGGDMARLRAQPWHASPLLGAYRFFDVAGVQARGHKGQSLVNENEVRVALQLYRRLLADYGGQQGGPANTAAAHGNNNNNNNNTKDPPFYRKIGIITPYKAQLYALRQRFADQFGPAITDAVEFNTTDAFQGRECEIIIFSCVRASPTGGIGFMTDIRRMNVGLTRARSSLWILGDARALRQGEFWHKLIQDAKERKRYTGGDVLGLLKATAASSGKGQTARAAPPLQQGGSGGGGGGGGSAQPKGQRSSNASNSGHGSGGSNANGTSSNASVVPLPPKPLAEGGWRGGFATQPQKANKEEEEEEEDGYSPPPAAAPPPPGPPISPSDVGLGGINERGEPLPNGPAVSARPVIVPSSSLSSSSSRPSAPETAVPTGPAASRKRPHDGPSAPAPPVKRPVLPSSLPPKPPARRPTDPSAMEVLGIGKEAPPPQQPAPRPRPPLRPPKKKSSAADAMFIKKKNNRRT